MKSFVTHFFISTAILIFALSGVAWGDTIISENFSTNNNYTVTLGEKEVMELLIIFSAQTVQI
ncbi:MAG: hypothetical protein U5N56_03050 [Candidatus Marinimicrobia bacterium]|nr:hypothetical protein [Candidatus Neomarinimicrobiota bacterium]